MANKNKIQLKPLYDGMKVSKKKWNIKDAIKAARRLKALEDKLIASGRMRYDESLEYQAKMMRSY